MKKIIFASFIFGVLIACNSGNKKEEKKSGTETTTPENPNANNPDYEKGLALVAQNGCFACHHVVDKVSGPSYTEIANKYAGMPDTIVAYLAGKVRNGVPSGTGVWGQIPMIAHPSVSKEDAEAMVKYVLLLKK